MASTSTTNPPSHKDAKRRGSLHNQLVWTAPASASTNSCVVLPLGNHVVTAAKRSTGALQQDLRIPAEANELTPFSCWQCLAHPDEASDTLVTQGYGRLQILLAYLLPEVIDVYEDNLEASQLSTPLAKQALDDADANKPGREDTAATLSDYKPNFTITSLAPSKGYVRISLNGVPVYRSSILDISPDALNETAAVVKGEKDETKLPNTIFNERIEIQIHWPYSVLRVELFNRDTTLGVVADDDLLGVFEMPIHLMLPFKIYDLE
ncbi:transmembrane protein [Cystoisospora suis]|uniref:Transmembrane protein n=1 Tax=Cystoisospora suis TaxID=483139 RepID=A0A2C6KI59_9APIC|nr:transmembrane protein [Cystoisospora suis]